MRRVLLCILFLILVLFGLGWLGGKIPQGFVPTEDQGYLYANLELPATASLQRTAAVSKQVEDILLKTPGVQGVTTVAGFSLLSGVSTTYSGFFFITLKPWNERTSAEEHLRGILEHANQSLSKIPEGIAFVFSPRPSQVSARREV